MGRVRRVVMPSRILNDQRGVFGLWLTDFAAGIVVFMGGSWFLEDTGYELVSLPLAALVLVALSPIRLSTRRKIIRDYIRWRLTPRRLYDPSKRVSA